MMKIDKQVLCWEGEEEMAKIGRNIREQRMKKGLSQEELAEKLYVTRQTISNYETGKSNPDVEMLARIAEELDIDIQLLIYGETKKRDMKQIRTAAELTGLKIKEARVHSSDVFYAADHMDDFRAIYAKHGCQCVEMESFALFHNANVSGKKAACLLTISDSFVTHEELSALARQESFENMMKVALETCIL